jgi:two-component system NarL family response regulator
MTDEARIRVVVVDDHPVVRRGIIDVLRSEPGLDVVADAGDGRAAIELYRQHRPDVLVVDLDMPDIGGAEVTRRLCQEDPGARVLVLTVHDGEEAVSRCLEAGARGYVLKRAPAEEIIAAIRTVSGGRRAVDPALGEALANRVGAPKLTVRELEVLEEMAHGKDNREIAAELGITEGTTKWYVTSILAKLGVTDRTKAVLVALRRGLVRL